MPRDPEPRLAGAWDRCLTSRCCIHMVDPGASRLLHGHRFFSVPVRDLGQGKIRID